MLAAITNIIFHYVKSTAVVVKRCSSMLVSVLLLAVLMSSAIYVIDIKKALSIILAMDPSWLVLALAVTIITILVNSYRFALIASWVLREKAQYGKAVKVTWLGCFVALSTPFAALGDVARAGLMKFVMSVSVRKSIEVILFDRGFGLLCLLIFALLSSLWCGLYIQQQHWLLYALVLMPAFAIASLLAIIIVHHFVNWPDNRICNYLESILDQLAFLMRQPSCLAQQMLITFLNVLLYVTTFVILSHTMNFSYDISTLLIFSPLILIINNLPFFYMGWGGREAVMLMLMPILAPGADSELILAASMSYGVVFMLVSLMGGFYLLSPSMLRNKFYGRT